MKFIYFGSSDFSKGTLDILFNRGLSPLLIVSREDKPKGRGLKVFPTKVSIFAKENKISLIKPLSLSDDGVKEMIFSQEARFFVVADYGKIIPESLLSNQKTIPICVHPSLLPKYRGPAPIEYALMNGDEMSGVTIFKINKKIDAGDIILQKETLIGPEDNFISLSSKLAIEGGSLLIEAMEKIINNKHKFRLQNENKVIDTFKLKKEDGRISWNRSAFAINNLIRATFGWPSAYTYYNELMIKILSAEILDKSLTANPGVIVGISKAGLDVATSKGVLRVKKIIPQGKKIMDSWSFICGHKIRVEDKFS